MKVSEIVKIPKGTKLRYTGGFGEETVTLSGVSKNVPLGRGAYACRAFVTLADGRETMVRPVNLSTIPNTPVNLSTIPNTEETTS